MSLAAGQFKDKTFLAGIGDLINMMEDPDRYGSQWLARIATGFVPNLVQQPIKASDPHIRDTKPGGDNGFIGELAQRMKFNLLPQAAPPRMDVWGRPVFKNNGDQHDQPSTDLPLRLLSPVRSGSADALPIDRYILAYNTKHPDDAWAPTAMDNVLEATINGHKGSLKLSGKETAELHQQAGQAALKALGNDWDWRNPDAHGIRRIKDTLEHYRRHYRDTFKRKRADDLRESAKHAKQLENR
jgi:hypothetical protein